MAKNIVVIRAGFAGLSFLFEIKKLLKDEVCVTVVDPRKNALNRPTMPEVAFEHKPVESTLFPIRKPVEHAGGIFIQKRADLIDPKACEVTLEDGQKLKYDYLYIATGGVKDYAAIEGFYQYGYSLCDEEQAARLSVALDNFRGGPILVGACDTEFGTSLKDVKNLGAPCEGPVGEAMFMIDYRLRHTGMREHSPISAFTPGDKFFEDVGPKVHEAFGPLLQESNIDVLLSKKLTKVGPDYAEFADGSKLESALTVVIPPYKAHRVCINSNIGDEKGFIPTDMTMKHVNYDNIYCAGDASARTMPKLGHLAVMGAKIAACAINKDITGKGEIPPYEPEVLCIMNRGGGEATMIRSDIFFGGNHDVTFSGRVAHFMKWSFDLYFGFTNGHMPPNMLEGLVKKFLKN